jgi:GNAT superfamily N-acetyltransferase
MQPHDVSIMAQSRFFRPGLAMVHPQRPPTAALSLPVPSSQEAPEPNGAGRLVLSFDLEPSAAETRLIAEGLFETIEHVLGTPLLRQPFSIFVRAPGGAVCGGVNARIAFGDLHVDQLWCAREVRGRGYGSLLLAEAERYGRQQRAGQSLLNTFDAALVGFYEKRGYALMGVVPGLAARRPVYFLGKSL